MDCDKGYDYRQLRLALRKRRIIPRITRCECLGFGGGI